MTVEERETKTTKSNEQKKKLTEKEKKTQVSTHTKCGAALCTRAVKCSFSRFNRNASACCCVASTSNSDQRAAEMVTRSREFSSREFSPAASVGADWSRPGRRWRRR